MFPLQKRTLRYSTTALSQPDQITRCSSIREMEDFFDMQNKLILTSSNHEDGLFLSTLVLSRIFLQFSVLPDDVILQSLKSDGIFCQLSSAG
jgi:hypothetical protein